MSFWKELSRRNVVKVGVAYAVAAWLIIHPVDIVFPILHLPEWSITLVAAFLIICFPFVLIFSWVYEVTPKGLKKTKDVPLSKSTTHVTGRKLNYIIIGLLVVAVALLIFDNFYLDRRTVETKQAPATSDVDKTKKTIAVLPFENLSSDPEQVYFVDGLSEEILNRLCQISDLTVIARTSSFSFKGTNKKVQEIANELGVDNILEGSVRKAGNELRITAQLVKAVDGSHLWSKTYDRELKDIFIVQEDIAIAVANELKATLGIGKSLKQLGGTDNAEAYGLYLAALGQELNSINDGNRCLELLNAAITLDPKFALAWAKKAAAHSWFAQADSPDNSGKAFDEALLAAQKAVELEPNLLDGYVSLGFIKAGKDDFIGAEAAFRKAFGPTTKPLTADSMILAAVYYHAIGYFKKAHEIILEARKNDPLNQSALQQYMFNSAFQNDRHGAEEEYERGMALLGDNWKVGGYGHITMVRLGSGDILSSDDIISPDHIYVMAKEHLESPKEGLEGLRRFTTNEHNISSGDLASIALWAAYFGDSNFAMDNMEKSVRIHGIHAFFSGFR